MKTKLATLGAGCFWGVEAIFQKVNGVISVTSGYTGGVLDNPSYEDICTGTSGHAEVVQIEFDPSLVSFENLLNYFWRLHDPTTLNSQGYDVGTQYRSVIFYHDDEQREVAVKSRDDRNQSGKHEKPIVTEITALQKFYPAEDYHQNYYLKKYEGSSGPICHILRDE